jgi:hypothetical protein
MSRGDDFARMGIQRFVVVELDLERHRARHALNKHHARGLAISAIHDRDGGLEHKACLDRGVPLVPSYVACCVTLPRDHSSRGCLFFCGRFA